MRKNFLIKTLSLVMALAFCRQAVFPPVAYAVSGSDDNGPKYDYFSKSNKPTLYGTTAIKVPLGTEIDYEHDARFRVFAKDNEDFDLTNKIQMSDNGLDVNTAGEYEIYYSVTDSDGNTVSITVPVEIVEESTEIWLEKTMYTLPSVDHLNSTGHTRGNYMDRQIIGIFLDDDEEGNVPSFEMRKISGSQDLIVPLQNNNGWCESTATVKGEYSAEGDEGWQTIQNTGDKNQTPDGPLVAVPTVKSLYKETGPVVYEVRWDSTDERIKPLHYYHEGDGFEYETRFLAEWKADIDSFAVLDGVSLMALMPYEDRAKVYEKAVERSFDSFDEMFSYWTTMLNGYDKLIGISYTPDYYWNQAVKTKFFIRANKHGAGGAYYAAGDCVGKNATTMYSALHPWWGTMHEYGHGYQGNVGSSGYGMPLTEVAVNIFSYYGQKISGLYPVNEDWLGNIDAKEDDWNNKRKAGVTYQDTILGSDATLYVLLNMLLSFDDYVETYAYINQYFRQVYFTTGKKLNTQDAWTLALAEKYNVNLIPYFESWGIKVSDSTKDYMMSGDARVIYYINDMVSGDGVASELKEKFRTNGEYGLITTTQLQGENLFGTVKIKFNIPDFNVIKGGYMYINNGDKQVAKVEVTNPEMTVTLPAGVYKVAPPRGNIALEYDRFYMTVVADSETTYEINYKEYNSISGGNDVIIYCRGYWSEDAHPFTVQVIGNKMQIDYQDTYPNSGGTSDKAIFSKLSLYDDKGALVYEKSVNGGWYDVFMDDGIKQVTFDVKPGYKLNIYYRGPKTDMRYVSQLTGRAVSGYDIPADTHERTYVVTKYGLVPEDMTDDEEIIYNMYKDRVNRRAEKFLQENKNINDPFKTDPNRLNELINLINSLKPEDKAEYVGVLIEEKKEDNTDKKPSDNSGKTESKPPVSSGAQSSTDSSSSKSSSASRRYVSSLTPTQSSSSEQSYSETDSSDSYTSSDYSSSVSDNRAEPAGVNKDNELKKDTLFIEIIAFACMAMSAVAGIIYMISRKNKR